MGNNGHYRPGGAKKVCYNSEETAIAEALAASKRYGMGFKHYQCKKRNCLSWHIGKVQPELERFQALWLYDELGIRATYCLRYENYDNFGKRENVIRKRFDAIWRRQAPTDIVESRDNRMA